ncbi:uncharacterized protein L203_105283 [Cryptococcus depauperatus CBS 7841]|uniref:Uncharacterized protein n=1 Tax=Cryptococcus depauperatus CBS 7841 TaxID=1295531 RepID=A0A1E3I069_9TREE|nr:hypothetical protein L203_05655 [Cryptococcus depauperatus CBS 7841]
MQYHITSLDRLEPVQDLILYFLALIAPAKYLLLSSQHYDHIVPLLYQHVAIDESLLQGLTGVSRQRSIRAVRHAKSLSISRIPLWTISNYIGAGRMGFPMSLEVSRSFYGIERLDWTARVPDMEDVCPLRQSEVKCSAIDQGIVFLWQLYRRPLELIVRLNFLPSNVNLKIPRNTLCYVCDRSMPDTVTVVFSLPSEQQAAWPTFISIMPDQLRVWQPKMLRVVFDASDKELDDQENGIVGMICSHLLTRALDAQTPSDNVMVQGLQNGGIDPKGCVQYHLPISPQNIKKKAVEMISEKERKLKATSMWSEAMRLLKHHCEFVQLDREYFAPRKSGVDRLTVQEERLYAANIRP